MRAPRGRPPWSNLSRTGSDVEKHSSPFFLHKSSACHQKQNNITTNERLRAISQQDLMGCLSDLRFSRSVNKLYWPDAGAPEQRDNWVRPAAWAPREWRTEHPYTRQSYTSLHCTTVPQTAAINMIKEQVRMVELSYLAGFHLMPLESLAEISWDARPP